MEPGTQARVLIVGAGFAGVRLAQRLSKWPERFAVTLMSDRPCFEYYPTLYRVVVGYSARPTAIPLEQVFVGTSVQLLFEPLKEVHREAKVAVSQTGQSISYDYLVLALGGQTTFYDIPGLAERSFSFKGLHDAQRLRDHLHGALEGIAKGGQSKSEQVAGAHIVFVGAGPTGVEVAADMYGYLRLLARKRKIDEALITVSLIEGSSRILPALPPEVSQRVQRRLEKIGVQVYTNRLVTEQEAQELVLGDIRVPTRTVVWTSGATSHEFYKRHGYAANEQGKVLVDEHMRVPGELHTFVLGDAAATPYAGMAQTALQDAEHVARYLCACPGEVGPHVQYQPVTAIPVGQLWAVLSWKRVRIYGFVARMLRDLADLRFLISLLPVTEATRVFLQGLRRTP